MSGDATGPLAPEIRRILSIDGGGVRCIVAMEYLCALEREVRLATGDPGRRLCEHFDLVVGTSAGGLLATGIALGIPMDEVRAFVDAQVSAMFTRSRRLERFRAVYDKRSLGRGLRERLGEGVTLGSGELRTGLALVVRDWSNDAAWFVANRAGAAPDGDPEDPHLDLPLWRLALASASAPAYFRPEVVRYGRSAPREVVLDDGGMTGYLNPAFRAFRHAALDPDGPRWATGETVLSILSIGSGDAPHRRRLPRRGTSVPAAVLGMPNAMLQASVREQDGLCRAFGRCVGSADGAMEEAGKDGLERFPSAVLPLFSYRRVNPSLATEALDALGFAGLTAGRVMRMDAHANAGLLAEIGRAVAERDVGEAVADCVGSGLRIADAGGCDTVGVPVQSSRGDRVEGGRWGVPGRFDAYPFVELPCGQVPFDAAHRRDGAVVRRSSESR